MTASGALRLDLDLPPDWSRIDPAREAVGLLVLAVSGDDNLRDALAMVSEELLENAIKYSKPETSVSLRVHEGDAGVVVSVRNAIDDGQRAHADALRERVAWMRTFPSASQAYTAAIRGVSTRPRPTEDAGLGIVRIAYEGRCGVEVDLSEPGMVTVRAACRRQ